MQSIILLSQSIIVLSQSIIVLLQRNIVLVQSIIVLCKVSLYCRKGSSYANLATVVLEAQSSATEDLNHKRNGNDLPRKRLIKASEFALKIL